MKENIYTTGCKTVRRLWLAAVAVCVAVATCAENAVGLLLKIENDLGGHTSSYCWSEACFAALENCFGTKTVRILAGTNRSGGVSRFDAICNAGGQYSVVAVA